MLPIGNINLTYGLCEICVTECCAVVPGTEFAMDVASISCN
jgi:hypothetical protein